MRGGYDSRLNYVLWKRRKDVAADLRHIYQAATAEEAELRLGEFEAKWDSDYLPIGQSWRRNWSRLTPFFDYPAEIRKVIYTTNAIESVNMGLRKLSKNRGSFPSDEALTKLFYLALRNISQKWTKPIRDWKAALTRFTIQFEPHLRQLKSEPFTQKFGHAPMLHELAQPRSIDSLSVLLSHFSRRPARYALLPANVCSGR